MGRASVRSVESVLAVTSANILGGLSCPTLNPKPYQWQHPIAAVPSHRHDCCGASWRVL